MNYIVGIRNSFFKWFYPVVLGAFRSALGVAAFSYCTALSRRLCLRLRLPTRCLVNRVLRQGISTPKCQVIHPCVRST